MMKLIKKIYHFIVDAKIPTLSGSVCFFLLLNGGSYFFLFVSLSSYFLIDLYPYLEEHLEASLFKDVVLYLFEHNANLSISLFLLISSIYSSSSLYYHFMHVCELITKQPVDNRFSKRLQALVLVPLVLLSAFQFIGLLSVIQMLWGDITYLFFMTFILLFIYLLNKIALRRYSVKRLWKGIVFSFLYAVVFSFFFILYLKNFSNFKIVYGLLSFIIIFLFYLYSITIGIFIGIYMNCKNLEVSQFLFE